MRENYKRRDLMKELPRRFADNIFPKFHHN
jgi:hypothetical protein